MPNSILTAMKRAFGLNCCEVRKWSLEVRQLRKRQDKREAHGGTLREHEESAAHKDTTRAKRLRIAEVTSDWRVSLDTYQGT